jgi:hypothetical protein
MLIGDLSATEGQDDAIVGLILASTELRREADKILL